MKGKSCAPCPGRQEQHTGGGARGQRQAACSDCELRRCDAVRLKAAAGGEKPAEGRRGSSSPTEGRVHPTSIHPVRGKGAKSSPSTGRVHAAGLGTSGLLWVWGRVLTSGVASTWGSSAWQTSI